MFFVRHRSVPWFVSKRSSSRPRLFPRVLIGSAGMFAKVSIWLAMVCFVTALVFGALGTFGVGLSEPPPRSEDISERIVNNFETYEEDYLLWGRWIDLGWALGFAGLLIAAPFLPRVDRARHMLVAGAALAVAGELIDLSKLAGIEIARIGLDNDLADDLRRGMCSATPSTPPLRMCGLPGCSSSPWVCWFWPEIPSTDGCESCPMS